jgi:hypothetical protein
LPCINLPPDGSPLSPPLQQQLLQALLQAINFLWREQPVQKDKMRSAVRHLARSAPQKLQEFLAVAEYDTVREYLGDPACSAAGEKDARDILDTLLCPACLPTPGTTSK